MNEMNVFFKEVFDREVRRLIASGLTNAQSAAQALVSAQSAVVERSRHQHQITLPDTISGTVTAVDNATTTLVAVPVNPPAFAAVNVELESDPYTATLEDKRKGKLAANISSMANKTKVISKDEVHVPTPIIDYGEIKEILTECVKTGNFGPIIRVVFDSFSDVKSLNKSFAISPSSSSVTFTSVSSSCFSGGDSMKVEEGFDESASSKTNNSISTSASVCSATTAITDVDNNEDRMDLDIANDLQSTCLTGNENEKKMSSNDESDTSLVSNKKGLNVDLNEKSAFSESADRIYIDIESVNKVYKLLLGCDNEGVSNSLAHALESLTHSIPFNAGSCLTPESLKHILVVMEHPDLLDPRYYIYIYIYVFYIKPHSFMFFM
jgi:hypothetical protein